MFRVAGKLETHIITYTLVFEHFESQNYDLEIDFYFQREISSGFSETVNEN